MLASLAHFQGFIRCGSVRRIAPSRLCTSRIGLPGRISCMEFICYGWEIINYIIYSPSSVPVAQVLVIAITGPEKLQATAFSLLLGAKWCHANHGGLLGLKFRENNGLVYNVGVVFQIMFTKSDLKLMNVRVEL